jgi:adenylate cyclase
VDPVLGGSDLCCGVCGNGLRASARFCDACGSAVSPSRAVGERKQVTVLFADVVGSMELAAILDPERLREIMHQLLNRSAAVVQRYQGTVNQFTGDGLMALFGAPFALEDHALRACITALEIQSEARGLAADVLAREGVALQIRIGLNSGEVIAGEVGVGPGSYTAVGHPVGMAQRMEAAAEPGGVMCTASTARLVEHSAVLGPTEWVTVKGAGEPVPARRLERVESDRTVLGRDEGPLMGRDADLAELLDAINGRQISVVSVVGEPGLGKSRLIRELAAGAPTTGAEIVIARCESHTANVPLHALSRMLRAMFGIRGLDAATARVHIAAQLEGVVEPDSGDSDILFDLLSIGDPETTAPTMKPDARRRRLIEVMGNVAKTRPARTLFVVEDLHWVDAASEGVLAKFAETLTATQSMLVGSFRPEYHGALREMSETTIMLAPLNAWTTVSLTAELIGQDATVRGVAERIAQAGAGNPFFVEEIVRDLVGRGLLLGNRGDYRLIGDLDSVAVPATVQSVIAARIYRLTVPEKSILNAAAVIGSSFDLDVLHAVLADTESGHLRNLVSAELIDQIQFLPEPRYAFRHPLVRAVSYESQLTATRADGHRRLAAAIEARNPSAVEQNSALIAQHLEAAGELGASYTWYMRSADWLRHRDMKGVLVDHVLAAVDHGQVGGADDFAGSGVVGGQICRVLVAEPGLAQRVDEPVSGERLAARRADHHPVPQSERLQPQPVNARGVSGGVHREHLPAARPHRASGAGALLAPVERRADRLGGAHRVERRGRRVGYVAGSGTGGADRQSGNPAGQLHVLVEGQTREHRVGKCVSGFGERGLPLGHWQRTRLALGVDGPGDIEGARCSAWPPRHRRCR